MSLDRKIDTIIPVVHSILEFISVQNNFKEDLKKITESKFNHSMIQGERKKAIENAIQEYKSLLTGLLKHLPEIKNQDKDSIQSKPEESIALLKNYFEDHYQVIMNKLIAIKEFYSNTLSTFSEIQKNELNTLYIKPIQHIVRYELLVKAIEDSISRSNLDQKETFLKSINLIKKIISNSNNNNTLKTIETNTPQKKQKLKTFQNIHKNKNTKEIIKLLEILNFFKSKKEKSIDFQDQLIMINFLIYAHSFKRVNLNKDNALESLEEKIFSIVSEDKQNFFLTTEEKKELQSIFKTLTLDESQIPESQINQYHLEIENVIFSDLNTVAEKIKNETYKKDFLNAIQKLNLSESKKILKDNLSEILLDLNKKYSLYPNDIFENPIYSDFFSLIKLIKKCLKSFCMPEEMNNDTPVAQGGKSKKQLTKFSILSKNNPSNAKEDFFEIKFEYLFKNLLRIFNYYSDNALGKQLITNEEIAQESQGRGWMPQLLILMKNSFRLYLNSTGNKKIEYLTDEISTCISSITSAPSIGNVVNYVTQSNISKSELLNSLKFLHDAYRVSKHKKFLDDDLSRRLPRGIIKPIPHENIEEYFQKTFLLYLQETLPNKKFPVTEEIKKQLQFWCFIENQEDNTRTRLESIRSLTPNSKSLDPNSKENDMNFLNALSVYFESKDKELNETKKSSHYLTPLLSVLANPSLQANTEYQDILRKINDCIIAPSRAQALSQ